MRRAIALVVVLLCAPAHAAPPKKIAPKPQIVDVAGDQVAAFGAAYDVRSALFSTAGTLTRKGKKVVYTPTTLVVTLTYAAPVPADLYAAQVVTFATDTCRVYLEAFGAGHDTYGSSSCTDDATTFGVRTAGATMTFTVPLAAVGLKVGVELHKLTTWTNVAEPTTGYESGDLVGSGVTVDFATTATAFPIR